MSSGIVLIKGFFTTQKYLQGKTLYEIEKLLGFNEHRLSKGAWFFAATALPGVNDFELAGYSQVAGHNTAKQYGNINDPNDQSGKNALQIQKKNVIASWRVHGWERLIKVRPGIDHNNSLSDDYQYPPGHGIPQWKIINPIPCQAICFVGDYPKGKFIPDQDYTPTKYK